MSIAIICPGCQAQFRVSDKFAGKTGPCPKCKATISIPAATPEIKVHAPEEYASGGKDAKGRAITKPIPREKTRVSKLAWAIIAACVIAAVGGAIAIRIVFQGNPPVIVVIAAVALLSLPVVRLGYALLRDVELEPYSGKSLYIRLAICAAIYCVLWIVLRFLPAGYTAEMWGWFFVAPAFFIAGTTTAYATLDLDFGSAFFHYCHYLAIVLLLRWIAGMPPLWAGIITT